MSRLSRLAESTQTIITAFILAFVYRAYFLEPFIIPTGSMADSLLGVHATWRCAICGWEFDYGSAESSRNVSAFVAPSEVLCPNCHTPWAVDPQAVEPRNGDRILVHKWCPEAGGAFGAEPWDVIVFRDPLDPTTNYIKRLVALPGDSIEIVQGDIFVDGKISRKPDGAQRALWMLVFDQDYFPPKESLPDFVRWQPVSPAAAESWSGLRARELRFQAAAPGPQMIEFDAGPRDDYFRDVYAYNRGDSGARVGDLRVRAELGWEQAGACHLEIQRGQTLCQLRIASTGEIGLRVESLAGEFSPITRTGWAAGIASARAGRRALVEFAHVDYRVYIQIDGRTVLRTGDEYTPDVYRLRGEPDLPAPKIRLAGEEGGFTLRGLRIDRDVHYVAYGGRTLRAMPGEPFTLGSDEYFVLGDNSPDSHDSREWPLRFGPHLPADYRPGTVRRDQIVGKAAFVYLPGLLQTPWIPGLRVPDVGRVRFIR